MSQSIGKWTRFDHPDTPHIGAEAGLIYSWRGDLQGVPRPIIRLEAAHPKCQRLALHGESLVWFYVDDFFEYFALSSKSESVRHLHLMPPISAAHLRGITAEPGSNEWWRAWMRFVGDRLAMTVINPRLSSHWQIAPQFPDKPKRPFDGRLSAAPRETRPALPRLRPSMIRQADVRSTLLLGEIWSRRPPALPESGRLKWWRKVVRSGACPPVVLMYWDVLGGWLVLDGHNRLHACLLEGQPPPLLGLWRAGTPFYSPPQTRVREGIDDDEEEVAVQLALLNDPYLARVQEMINRAPPEKRPQLIGGLNLELLEDPLRVRIELMLEKERQEKELQKDKPEQVPEVKPADDVPRMRGPEISLDGGIMPMAGGRERWMREVESCLKELGHDGYSFREDLSRLRRRWARAQASR